MRCDLFIYLFGVLRRFQHCTGHITTGSWKGRGNQYIEFIRVLYCKLPTNGKQLPAFPLEAMLEMRCESNHSIIVIFPVHHTCICFNSLIVYFINRSEKYCISDMTSTHIWVSDICIIFFNLIIIMN